MIMNIVQESAALIFNVSIFARPTELSKLQLLPNGCVHVPLL